MHQQAYARAFGSADRVLIAPLGRSNIDASERLDLGRLIADLNAAGKSAGAPADIEDIVKTLAKEARSGDAIALLSNGAFGGIHGRLLKALAR
jgi:UDP-N-acetylmuramate: L-alanyl-gamma-D-glutamyl-meso-diaminopimelate ligase